MTTASMRKRKTIVEALARAARRTRALATARAIVGPKYDGSIPLPSAMATHPALTAKPTETYPNPDDVGGWHYVIEPNDESWIAFVGVDGKALLWTKRANDGGVIGAPYEFRRDDLKTRGAVSASRRVAFVFLARACEASAPGEAPDAFRILAAGVNATDKGDLVFTPRSARLVMQAFTKRGNPLAIYYEHEDRLPLQERGGSPMKGVCSAPSADLAIRGPDAAPECWAESVAWTAEAKRQITTGERRQISPVAAYDEDTREVLEILNVSLCGEGATHNGTLLASREGRTGSVDELIDQIMGALQAGDFETAEDLVQQAEAMAEGGDSMSVKMARAALKGAKPAPAADPPPPADVATKRLAASRDARAVEDAFARGMADLKRATDGANIAAKQSRKATVQTLIAANRDLFDVADEREHMIMADPDATQRHIASLSRKVKAGVAVLSKGADDATVKKDPKAPKDAPVVSDDTLSDGERAVMDQFNRGQKDPKKHLTEADMLASKRNVRGGAAVRKDSVA